jgi:hypothetical protein
MVSSHENVIRYVSMRVNMDEVFQIFLEYAGGGELFDQIGQCVVEFLKTETKRLKHVPRENRASDVTKNFSSLNEN